MTNLKHIFIADRKNFLVYKATSFFCECISKFNHQNNLILFYKELKYTVREQARKHRKMMRCSDPKRKPWEISRNEISADGQVIKQQNVASRGKGKIHLFASRLWKRPMHKLNFNVHVKSLLIDLEAYGISYGDRAEGASHRDRLSEETSNMDAIVKTTEETCRGEFEAVSPPRNWSVSKLLLKVIEWLRHTAGCSFYQGQCITQDLWGQNLRSTGI